jgi:hypothetical protein
MLKSSVLKNQFFALPTDKTDQQLGQKCDILGSVSFRV